MSGQRLTRDEPNDQHPFYLLSGRMRDMLARLQAISEEQEFNEPDYHNVTVLAEHSSAIDSLLKEAHNIRKDISMLHSQVDHLKRKNERFSTSVRRLTLLKKDSDSVARAIQQRGEAIYVRLRDLGKETIQLEEKEGHSSAVSRIARVQYDTLTQTFNSLMNDYNMAEEMQRSTCRERIQRQACIMGSEVTDEQLDVLVDKGGEGWTELSQSLQTQGAHSSRWALFEIKGRHKELVELEARLKDVRELFLHMALLVEEQGSMVNNIEANVCSTEEYVEKVNVQIKKALKYKKRNPCLLCCPCLSCWKHIQMF